MDSDEQTTVNTVFLLITYQDAYLKTHFMIHSTTITTFAWCTWHPVMQPLYTGSCLFALVYKFLIKWQWEGLTCLVTRQTLPSDEVNPCHQAKAAEIKLISYIFSVPVIEQYWPQAGLQWKCFFCYRTCFLHYWKWENWVFFGLFDFVSTVNDSYQYNTA